MTTVYHVRSFQQSSESISQQEAVTDTGYLSVSEAVDNGTPLTVDVVVDNSAMSSAFLSTDSACTMVFSPDGPSITLAANSPYQWTITNPAANLFTDPTATCVITSTVTDATANVNLRFTFTA